MAFLSKLARRLYPATPYPLLKFPATGFAVVRDSQLLEEEQLEELHDGKYYPVRIGEVFDSKYQVVGKLGFGSTSTVWLARDMP